MQNDQKPKNLHEFEAEWLRIRTEMETAIAGVEGHAFIVASLALQYAIRSLQLQQYHTDQIEQLVRDLTRTTPANRLH